MCYNLNIDPRKLPWIKGWKSHMNPMNFLQMKSALDGFRKRHPKVVQFVQTMAKNGIRKDSVIEITVTTPEGESYQANMKVMQEDLELISRLRELQQ